MQRRPRKIYATILALAKVLRTFNPRQLTHALSRSQAERNCKHLAKIGLLKRLSKGKPGHNGRPPTYSLPVRRR